jgi:general secretion pathway protein G
MRNNRKAFTLIELLVVIAIIGVITTIAVVSIGDARAKSRDAKRVADVKQIQTALELFRGDANRYPTSVEFVAGEDLVYNNGISTTTYIKIPEAPTPADGICSDNYNSYAYQSIDGGTNYRVSFCLGGRVGTLEGGRYVADLDGFTVWTASSCNDVREECDIACPVGSVCGGGTLISVSPNLIAAPSMNSESGCVNGEDCTGLEDNTTYVWGPSTSNGLAVSTTDGISNVEAIRTYAGGSLSTYLALKVCDDLNTSELFGFSDWYLPAQDEMFILGALFTSGLVPGESGSTVYWTSSETLDFWSGYSMVYAHNSGRQYPSSAYYVRCVRRF